MLSEDHVPGDLERALLVVVGIAEPSEPDRAARADGELSLRGKGIDAVAEAEADVGAG